MRIARRHLAAAGALARASATFRAHAKSLDEAAVCKAVDDLTQATIAADRTALEALSPTGRATVLRVARSRTRPLSWT